MSSVSQASDSSAALSSLFRASCNAFKDGSEGKSSDEKTGSRGEVVAKSLTRSDAKLLSFRAAASTCTGWFRKVNQDCFSLDMLLPSALFFGVWDGHGTLGHSAALLCDKIVPPRVATSIASGTSPEEAIASALSEAHKCISDVSRGQASALSSLARREIKNDYGTTGSCCVLSGRSLHLANVGDSRTVVFQRKRGKTRTAKATKKLDGWSEVMATRDHDPGSSESERLRVKRAGGELVHTGKELRVCPGDMVPKDARQAGLEINLTRSLGHSVLSKYGVIAEPDMARLELAHNVETLVLCASDGLWRVMNSEDALRIVVSSSSLEKACDSLLHECNSRWRRKETGDNITVVLVLIE